MYTNSISVINNTKLFLFMLTLFFTFLNLHLAPLTYLYSLNSCTGKVTLDLVGEVEVEDRVK
jgi:hypothetical protein